MGKLIPIQKQIQLYFPPNDHFWGLSKMIMRKLLLVTLFLMASLSLWALLSM